MGKVFGKDKLPFLTEKEFEEFNNIGYSGKNNKGKRVSRQEFLNSLDKGEFSVQKTKHDNGDFSEAFIIIHVPSNDYKEPIEIPQPLKDFDLTRVHEFAKSYIDFRVSERYHEDDEADWDQEMMGYVLEALYGNDINGRLKEFNI